jgi:hypothetical protein
MVLVARRNLILGQKLEAMAPRVSRCSRKLRVPQDLVTKSCLVKTKIGSAGYNAPHRREEVGTSKKNFSIEARTRGNAEYHAHTGSMDSCGFSAQNGTCPPRGQVPPAHGANLQLADSWRIAVAAPRHRHRPHLERELHL